VTPSLYARWWDVVAIADLGHGTLTDRLVGAAKEGTKFLGVNAQTKSANMAYNLVTRKYSGLDFACFLHQPLKFISTLLK
jgi:hypothetical protein